ncbi:HCNGP-like protein-domain-containing protein [Pseudomassariella vexata]|uniref:HCNGP-like protein-domain-containing protein n=1 Tax=Pseudomassariella vexata TaxID=1141098 RepID=A0A1Y2DSF8_9PEZI|nr:HCNGP-like protein-domain-containing protein [Pseudomassariella vexata]ORY62202.1 HCNGP-like protein-domain-containing protein [Pseudomassariella vexata]
MNFEVSNLLNPSRHITRILLSCFHLLNFSDSCENLDLFTVLSQMALVGYESSDEEEVAQQPVADVKSVPKNQEVTVEAIGYQSISSEKRASLPQQQPEKAEVIGPMLPPQNASNPTFPPLEDAPMEDDLPIPSLGSPYTANRALLRDLTLPQLPNMDIPPSPPGSPIPGTNKKFEQFLELKKKGVHFNSKIAQSSALKNPGLMDKLMEFVELDPRDQYRTTLGTDLWDPAVGFARHAYKEQLRLSQTEIGKARVRVQGAPVEFVPASEGSRDNTPGVSKPVSVCGTPTAAAGPGKRKTRFES